MLVRGAGAESFHFLLACITAAVLFGMVSGHFRVGRELYVWNERPCPWRRYPVLPEQPFSKISTEWRDRDKNIKVEKWREEEGADNSLPTEEKTFNDDRPGFLKRMKTWTRKASKAPYRVSEEGAQGGRANRNRVVPSHDFTNK